MNLDVIVYVILGIFLIVKITFWVLLIKGFLIVKRDMDSKEK